MATLILVDVFLSPPVRSQVEIDPSRGHIDGKIALSFWPATDGAGGSVLFPAGFTVHLVPSTDPNLEVVQPCGDWFIPAMGQYRFWLEGPNLISPSSSLMTFRGGPFTGKGGVSVSPVVGAGVVALDTEVVLPPGVAVLLLSLVSHRRGDRLDRELARRVNRENAYDGVLMPEGAVLAALFDQKSEEFLALSREAPVHMGQGTKVKPELPTPGTSDLVVVLDRPSPVGTKPDEEVILQISDALGQGREPDLFVPSAERVFGVWYGIQGRRAQLAVQSPEVYLDSVEIPLRPGKVEQFRSDLKRLPSLAVELRLPDGFPEDDNRIIVRWPENKSPISQVEVADTAEPLRFEHLPPTVLEVVLDAAPWRLIEKVDLSDGKDGHLVFEPQVIEVSGTVFRGLKTHPATLAFGTFRDPGDRAQTETDPSGNYKILLYRPGRYSVRVDLQGVEGPSFTEYLKHGLFESQTLDFHVPATDFQVRVVDAETRMGIEAAKITADNEFFDEDGPRTSSQPAVTDSSGIAALQPLRPGQVKIEVQVPGYRRPAPVVEPVYEASFERQITIALHRARDGKELQLLLADGRPAAGAEIQVRIDLGNAPVVWEGASDSKGRLTLPVSAEGKYVLIRHHTSGALVRFWHSTASDSPWRLPPAGPPLRVITEHSWGEPAPWAGLALWIDGHRLYGSALAWVARSMIAATDSHGTWVASLLPEIPFRLLAWSNSLRERGLSGALDSLAVRVTPPFPAEVEIPVVE